jgi:NAD(P)-dependent dehydrogenase (short-subunit alcohol dehydrogenase family)
MRIRLSDLRWVWLLCGDRLTCGTSGRRWCSRRFVNQRSVSPGACGLLPPPPGGCYHASKHALEALSDALRFEARPLGIDVVVIELGSFARASPRPRSTVWNPSPGRDPTGPATRLSRMRRQMPGVERDGEARRRSRGRRHAIEPAITARHPGRAARSLLGTAAAVTWCAAADHALGLPPRQSFPSPRMRSEAKEQAEKSGYQTHQTHKRPERKPEGGRSP